MAGSHVDFMRRWFAEIWDDGRSEAIDELLAPSGRIHGLGDPDQISIGPAGFRPFWAQFCDTFPERHFVVEDGVESGDRVAIRWRARLLHGGNAMGTQATNKWVEITGIAFAYVRNGQLQEGWNNWDSLELARAIDALAPIQPYVPRTTETTNEGR